MAESLEGFILIPMLEIKQGRQEFEFELNDDFFAQVAESEITGASVYVEIDVLPINEYLQIKLHIDGYVETACDRCLDEFRIAIDSDDELTISFANPIQERLSESKMDIVADEKETIYVSPSDEMIDLTQYCYENILFALPIQRVHGDNEKGESLCNPAMLAYLSTDTQDQSESTHSPFDILRNIDNTNTN